MAGPQTTILPSTVVKLQEPLPTRVPSTREQIILLEGSKLHGLVFPPWQRSPHASEFELRTGKAPFIDDAEFRMSDAQREIFDGWRRPDAALPPPSLRISTSVGLSPTMIAKGPSDLVQDVTTDCSVVASLCAVSARTERGHSTIISSTFHPYNHTLRSPAISSNGKYVFRLYFNGCFRKVVIDDRLPVSRTARNLHVIDRNNPELLWPALVEKAYLKIRGGYDFPGSNSGTDLWVLTGFIPEQLFLQSDDMVRADLWRRISNAFNYGDVLVTIGTGKLTKREEQYLGLIGEHDYAIVDVRELEVRQELLIKNPWSEGSNWKGNIGCDFPIGDDLSLSGIHEGSTGPRLSKARMTVSESENLTPGTFWMELNDVFLNFESMYLNWNPGLFSYRENVNFTWDLAASYGPQGSFARNPQYEIKCSGSGMVWLLLSRHFTTDSPTQAAHIENRISATTYSRGFISLCAFDNRGEKVFLNDGAMARGPYVDSPNTLLKIDFPYAASYTVVVSEQALPRRSCSFTLSAFSLKPLSIAEARDRYTHRKSYHGSWTFSTSGGNASSSVYHTNPQFSINLYSATDVSLLLETPDAHFPVHVKLVWANGRQVTSVTTRDIVGDSGEYKVGCAFAEIRNVQAGTYTIVCSTFERGQLGKFTLGIGTKSECTVNRVPVEEAGRLVSHLRTAFFSPKNDRLLAPLLVRHVTRLAMVARPNRRRSAPSTGASSPIKVALEYGQGPTKQIKGVSGNDEFAEGYTGVRVQNMDVQPEMCDARGLWIVLERLGFSGMHDDEGVDVDILSDRPIEVGLWGTGEG